MLTSPPPPAPRAPPKRTYARRARPAPRPSSDTESDTDEDEAGPSGKRAASPSPSASASKKPRVSPPLARVHSSGSATPSHPTPNPAVTIHPPSSVKSFVSRERDAASPARARSPRLRAEPSRPQSPRDLSDIFGAVSPSRAGESQESSSSNGRARPRSGLRRMLSKAQSMLVPAAPEEPTTPRALRTTQSMPITPSSAKSDRSGVSREAGSPTPAALALPPAVDSPGSGGRAQRTYGRSRTFLARPADEEGDAASLAASLAEPPRESYEELRKRYEVDNETGGSGNLLDALLARAPVPISDMRSKGENRRFMDEVTFLLEGISNAPSKGIRRTSSVDVLKNMQDPAWVAKMDICGQTDRVWDVLRTARSVDEDEVMEAVCLLFLDILVGSGGGLTSVLQMDAVSVVELIARNIALRTGPLDAAYASKVTPVVSNLRAIHRSVAHVEDDEITTRGAAARVLVTICGGAAWPLVEPLIPDAGVVPRAFSALAAEIQPLSTRLPLYAKGLDLLPKDPGAVDLAFLEQCLQALVSIVTDPSNRSEFAADTDSERLGVIMDIAVVMAAVAFTADGDLRRRASQCTVLALRLLRPLVSPLALRDGFGAHHRAGTVAALGRVLIGRETILTSLQGRPARTDADDEGADELSPDGLASLVLALFGSMDLDDREVAKLLAETAVSDCSKRPCAVSCRCSDTQPLAEALTRLYCDYWSRTDDALGSFLHGYLAYLLTKLLTVAPDAAGPLILPGLPGDSTRARLDGLHAALGDLHGLSTAVHRKLQEPSQALNGSGSLDSVASDDEGLSRALHDLHELRQQPPWP
ncbi:hypothetical protein Q8F55_002395 [Vanrija albida]|uniref:Wings apart-like protein C-terminal domain-containing protein n=1 Tax=Vanrija albida TaxID=181172 RepID=A0ABR3Q9P1_9TREE